MEKSLIVIGVIFACVFAKDEIEPWERLGLSITEWKLIQENKMPMSKVEQLLKDGIGISEYFRKPWDSLGIKEEKWIEMRRAGHSNEEIKILLQKHKMEIDEDNSFKEYDNREEKMKSFQSLFLPGYTQFQSGKKIRGTIMVSLAVGSIAGCTIWSIKEKQFISLPLFVILIPDMVWSLVDYKISK
ncbi:MAG: hypothetical protein N2053_12340 [Chitinispirillaceae bacterium]|nr:hypothetical protein [Chitinispirillaceae bacterium]